MSRPDPAPRALTRRLLPLQIGVGLLGVMLWVPIEKLFQTQIGFDAASIGLMAAAYGLDLTAHHLLRHHPVRAGLGGGVRLFREPRLHRAAEPVALRRHVATTFTAMTRIPQVRKMLLLAALTALLSQAVFEFGPLWLVELDAPAALYGPYWALLVATLGLGGYLAGRVHLDRRAPVVVIAVLLAAPPVLLATTSVLPLVALAQTLLALLLAIVGIHAGKLLHDAVPSAIRAGVSSGAGTFSWALFLPFSLVFGALARDHGVFWGGWVLTGVVVVLAVLLIASTRVPAAHPVPADVELVGDTRTGPPPADLACRELVGIVSDYVDGVLPPDWRDRADEHLRGCDGCTAYLQQIRETIDLLGRLDTTRSATDRPTGR
jgi:hypothetical protein